MDSLKCFINQIMDDISEVYPDKIDYLNKNLRDAFSLPDEKLVQVRDLLDEEISMRLNPETHHDSPLKFYPSFIEQVPDGTECGTYLAVDMGGTHCRVLAVDIREKKASTKVIMEDIPASFHTSSDSQIFDFIADCLHRLLSGCDLLNTTDPLPLGFTFSFPVKKLSLNKAILIQWCKDFHGNEMIGKDVVQLLKEAIAKRGNMNIHCCAIINDTIGTLMSGAFIDRNCKLGLICATGKLQKLSEETRDIYLTVLLYLCILYLYVALDTRWNNFGVDETIDFIRSQYDLDILRDTADCPQGIEKMISGMFLGEVVRRVLLRLHADNLLFTSWPQHWVDLYSLHTETVSEILRVNKGNIVDVNSILQDLCIDALSPAECRLVHGVCQLVITRAAYLTAACTSCLVNRVADKTVGIAVDGSVYKNIELFREVLQQKLNHLVKPDKQCYFVPCEDGSGLGAAIVASMVTKAGLDTSS